MAQEQIFSKLWDKFSQQVKTGEANTDFPDAKQLHFRHVTTIIRLPKPFGEKLEREVQEICPSDYHYPASEMHLTLLNLDPLLLGRQNINWKKLGGCIFEAIKGLPALKFTLRGLSLFPTTVYAQAYDINGGLELYRAATVNAVAAFLSANSDAADIPALVPGITFANIIRFRNKPDPLLTDFISGKRQLEIGSFQPADFELVTTNRLLSRAYTIQHAAIPLIM